jgi:hypothetical protein
MDVNEQRNPVLLTDEELNELTILVHNERRQSGDADWKELYRALETAPYVPPPWVTVDDDGRAVRMEPIPMGPAAEILAEALVGYFALFRAVPLDSEGGVR